MHRLLFKIATLLFLLHTGNGFAQTESYLLPFSNLVMINPSFAGLDKNTGFNTGNQYYYLDQYRSYNLFYATYDTYSEKLNGGLGFYFQQGLIGERNVSTTEFGVSFSGFPIKTQNGNILLSIANNFAIATKQWYVHVLDNVMKEETDPAQVPGQEFLRYGILKPKVGFLWESPALHIGFTAAVPLKIDIAEDAVDEFTKPSPLSLTVYIARNLNKKRKGLYSKPFLFSPEIVGFYNEEFIFGRLNFKAEHIDKTIGIFVQSDLSNNIHSLGGTLGYRSNTFRINFSSAVGIPGISDEIGFTNELALKIIVPPFNHSKNNPWARKKK